MLPGCPTSRPPSPHVFCLYLLHCPTFALCWAGARLSGVSLKVWAPAPGPARVALGVTEGYGATPPAADHPRPTSYKPPTNFTHKTLCFTVSIAHINAAKMEKCKNTVFFKGGVGSARCADKHNRHFVGVGHAPSARAAHVRPDGLTAALQMTQRRSQIWAR